MQKMDRPTGQYSENDDDLCTVRVCVRVAVCMSFCKFYDKF